MHAQSQPGSGAEVLAQAVCDVPLRITPLWALPSIAWTDIGGGRKLAPTITWSDPKRPRERYALIRHALDKPLDDGAQIMYRWIAANCATRETRDTAKYELTAADEVVGLDSGDVQWLALQKGTVASNAYVILCEQS
jgi:hypothetical protein